MKLFFLAKTLFLTLMGTILLSGSAVAFTEFDGTKTTIEDQVGDGKWSVVEVWASNCHACRHHMPQMVEFDGKMDNVRIVGIALDGQPGKDAAESMIKEYKMPFKNILSNPIEINAWMQQAADESLIGTPTFMIFDPKGKLVALQPGQLPVTSIESFIKSKS
ncbi:MAG: TlpA family protein disulfide reductase [Leucothrix sp.]